MKKGYLQVLVKPAGIIRSAEYKYVPCEILTEQFVGHFSGRRVLVKVNGEIKNVSFDSVFEAKK